MKWVANGYGCVIARERGPTPNTIRVAGQWVSADTWSIWTPSPPAAYTIAQCLQYERTYK